MNKETVTGLFGCGLIIIVALAATIIVAAAYKYLAS